MERLKQICDNEGVKIESAEVLQRLIQVTEGDLRRSINTLQTCSSFGKDKVLSVADIDLISGVVPAQVVLKVDSVIGANGVSYSDIQQLAEDLILEGYDCQQLLIQILDFYSLGAGGRKIADIKKARISELLAATDFNLLSGGSEELNMYNVLVSIASVLQSK